MKTNSIIHDLKFGILAMLLLILLCFSFTPSASAQLTPTTRAAAITNDTLIRMTNGTYTFATPTNAIVQVYQTTQLGMEVYLSTTNASTSNCTFTVEMTTDGTNWLTSPTLDFVAALNGTTATRYETNFPLVLTANIRAVRLKTAASTAIASWWPTNAAFLRR